MKPEIKKMWVEALTSGEFKQAEGQLRDDDKYCCLGVLCELHRRTTGIGEWRHSSNYLGCTADLPPEVQEWADLPDEDPTVRPKAKREKTLSEMNDAHPRWSFKRIANIIEERL